MVIFQSNHLKSGKHNVSNGTLATDYFKMMLRGETDSEAENE